MSAASARSGSFAITDTMSTTRRQDNVGKTRQECNETCWLGLRFNCVTMCCPSPVEAIKSVISRVVEQPAPWLVYTCGPMGVGKARSK